MPHESENHAAFYNRIAHLYDSIADGGEGAVRKTGEAELNVQPGESVLEIGYGTGHSLLVFAKAVGPEGRVSAIDISSSMQEVTKKRLSKEDGLLARVKLEVGDARDLPFADNSFDAAFSSFTLELFDDPEIPKVIGELHRVLKPGGRVGLVSMAIPDDPQHPSRLERAYVWLHQHFPHIVDCHPINLVPLLEAGGFEVSCREVIDIFTLPVNVLIATKRG